eukprot:5131723-Amphidinium_carterae.1
MAFGSHSISKSQMDLASCEETQRWLVRTFSAAYTEPTAKCIIHPDASNLSERPVGDDDGGSHRCATKHQKHCARVASEVMDAECAHVCTCGVREGSWRVCRWLHRLHCEVPPLLLIQMQDWRERKSCLRACYCRLWRCRQ